MDGGEPARRGGPGAREDGLGVLTAGLTQMGVEVHQAGQGDEPVGVDRDRVRPGLAGGVGTGRGDDAVAQEQVRGVAAQGAGRAEQVVGHEIPPEVSSPPARRR
ncbi:hypothetical protein GCM10022262_03590 [Georgenia daeguensis]|uniref:Uncharacterized protein n=1 Tax=Georgenia daeguensis TaxID=908355 RepID=A0ABP8EQ00_9MICO